MKKFTVAAKPLWETADEKPAFLQPSGVAYSRVSLETIEKRNISNRLLTSLSLALPDGAIIGGGFMTSFMAEDKQASDIDIFFTSEEAFGKTLRTFLDPTSIDGYDEQEHWAVNGYKLDEASQKNIIVEEILDTTHYKIVKTCRFVKFVHPTRLPIQLIKLAWYADAEAVIDSFDLTVAQFALDVKTCEIVANPLSYMDLARKRLVLHRMQFPSSTLRRIIKYSGKGYYACPGALNNIVKEIAQNIEKEDGKYVYVD